MCSYYKPVMNNVSSLKETQAFEWSLFYKKIFYSWVIPNLIPGIIFL